MTGLHPLQPHGQLEYTLLCVRVHFHALPKECTACVQPPFLSECQTIPNTCESHSTASWCPHVTTAETRVASNVGKSAQLVVLNRPVQIEAVSQNLVLWTACKYPFSLQERSQVVKFLLTSCGSTSCRRFTMVLCTVQHHSYHRLQWNTHRESPAMQRVCLHNATLSPTLGGEWVQRHCPPIMLSEVRTCIPPSKEEGRYCNTKMSSFAHKLTLEVYKQLHQAETSALAV